MTVLKSIAVPLFVYGEDKVVGRLNALLDLPDGWHYGSGKKVRRELVELTKAILPRLRAMGAKSFEAFPVLDGGVMLSAYRDAVDVDIIIHEADKVSLVVEAGDVELFEASELHIDVAIGIIGDNKWLSDGSSGSPTQYIIATSLTDLSLQRLAGQATTMVYPSSLNAAWKKATTHFVPTYGNTIFNQSAGTRLFSFDSRLTSSPERRSSPRKTLTA
jgi:hypothetical protein